VRTDPVRKHRRFIQCDVFSAQPGRGNALAVVVDAEGISDDDMRFFAAWTNLAETTFLLPPTDADADYRVRILTPSREMPFAGHPTLGSCAAWLHCGGVPKASGVVRQECGVGIVEIDISQAVPAFVAPPTTIKRLADRDMSAISSALGISPGNIVNSAELENGPKWHLLELGCAADVLAVDSSLVRWPQFNSIGLIGRHSENPDNQECDYEVRMLAPSSGMSEDPITGSLNSAIAHWLHSLGRLTSNLVVAQGTNIDRLGRVYIQPDATQDGRVLIGGHSHVLIDGHVQL